MNENFTFPDEPCISCPITIFYYDTDAGGVVHNIAYLRHIEEARTRLAEHLGWTLREMASGLLAPVVRRTEIDYLSPARLGDRLLVNARLIGLEGVSFDLGFEIFREHDPSLRLINCKQKLVCVNLKTMRPTRVPESWRKKWPHLKK